MTEDVKPEETREEKRNEFLKETQRLADKYNPKIDWDGKAAKTKRMTSGPTQLRYWVCQLSDVPFITSFMVSGAEYMDIIDVRPSGMSALIVFKGEDVEIEMALKKMTETRIGYLGMDRILGT